MEHKKFGFLGYYHYGIILTYLSAAAGIVGICMSATGRHWLGVICLLISGVCDAFDGAVANTRKGRSEEDKKFGEQIDSLSDLIAFGVAPVMIGWAMGMNKWYFIIVFCAYSLCALVRLAYFNVTEEIRIRENAGRRTSYEGLPVTNVAVGLPIFYLVARILGKVFNGGIVPLIVMSGCYILVGFLFVFRFKMPKLRIKGLLVTMLILCAILTVLLLVYFYAV